jgi:ferredoxin-type protein NapG
VAETPTPAKPRKKRRRRLSRHQEERRRILRAGVLMLGLLVLQPLAAIPVVRRWRSRLRPPGALDEEAFLGACIKCGQCVQVCPVSAIELADMGDGFGTGTPYIDARSQACDFSCDALSCILACPTGALSHGINTKEEVRCGLARLAHPDTCLARQGKGFQGIARGTGFRGRLRYEELDRWNPIPVRDHPYDRDPCDLCVVSCPIGDSALKLEPFLDDAGVERMTPVVGEACVGCGACEMICPQEPACIVIDPRKSWGEA